MPFKMSCWPELDYFHCCCYSCSLKNATVSLAWIQAIASILQLAWLLVHLVKSEELGQIFEFWKNTLCIENITHLFGFDSRDLCIALVSEASILALCCMLLLYGAHREKPGFMVPYLIVCQLGIGLLVIITAIIGFSEIFRLFIVGLGIIMAGSTLVVIASYLWLVKYSFYRKLIERDRRSRVQKDEVPTEKPTTEQETLA
ncbi:uncharacterized protein LOC110840530 [Zootermopsis nevadensis]|nr:uncharacterized protein LOC110840530 [Zootermopsis nevadensis]